MTFTKRVLRIGMPCLGLVLGLLCLGRAAESALAKPGKGIAADDERSDKKQTIVTGLVLGIPCTAGSLWSLVSTVRDRQLIESQQLHHIFQKALKANDGRIDPLQLAMLAEVPLEDADAFLAVWASRLSADFTVDEAGVVVYSFPVAEQNVLEDS
jgi:hypothetical protein